MVTHFDFLLGRQQTRNYQSPIGNGNYNDSHHFEHLGMENKINQDCEAVYIFTCLTPVEPKIDL